VLCRRFVCLSVPVLSIIRTGVGFLTITQRKHRRRVAGIFAARLVPATPPLWRAAALLSHTRRRLHADQAQRMGKLMTPFRGERLTNLNFPD